MENARVKSPRKSDNMRQRNKDDFNGKEKTMEEWIDIYERRAGDCDSTKFILNPREKVFFHPLHGFFTFVPDYDTGLMLIPKMCGDGRFLRKVLIEFLWSLKPYGCNGAKFCCRRKDGMYCKLVGGKVEKVEEMTDPGTGEKFPMTFYIVTWDDLKPGLRITEERKEVVSEDDN